MKKKILALCLSFLIGDYHSSNLNKTVSTQNQSIKPVSSKTSSIQNQSIKPVNTIDLNATRKNYSYKTPSDIFSYLLNIDEVGCFGDVCSSFSDTKNYYETHSSVNTPGFGIVLLHRYFFEKYGIVDFDLDLGNIPHSLEKIKAFYCTESSVETMFEGIKHYLNNSNMYESVSKYLNKGITQKKYQSILDKNTNSLVNAFAQINGDKEIFAKIVNLYLSFDEITQIGELNDIIPSYEQISKYLSEDIKKENYESLKDIYTNLFIGFSQINKDTPTFAKAVNELNGYLKQSESNEIHALCLLSEIFGKELSINDKSNYKNDCIAVLRAVFFGPSDESIAYDSAKNLEELTMYNTNRAKSFFINDSSQSNLNALLNADFKGIIFVTIDISLEKFIGNKILAELMYQMSCDGIVAIFIKGLSIKSEGLKEEIRKFSDILYDIECNRNKQNPKNQETFRFLRHNLCNVFIEISNNFSQVVDSEVYTKCDLPQNEGLINFHSEAKKFTSESISKRIKLLGNLNQFFAIHKFEAFLRTDKNQVGISLITEENFKKLEKHLFSNGSDLIRIFYEYLDLCKNTKK